LQYSTGKNRFFRLRIMEIYSKNGFPHYIIDGYNVILHHSYAYRLEEIGASRERFVMLLGAYRMKRRVSMTVVWDGSGSAFSRVEKEKGIRCIYTRPGISADEKIVRMVEEAKGRGVTVVSDDRRHITASVRNLGAQVMGVEQFLGLIGGLKRKRRTLMNNRDAIETQADKPTADDLSVEEWLTLFKAKEQKQ
jgi:predicted RNA-binding protein with PIN domain